MVHLPGKAFNPLRHTVRLKLVMAFNCVKVMGPMSQGAKVMGSMSQGAKVTGSK